MTQTVDMASEAFAAPPPQPDRRLGAWLFAATIFLSAFLLFQVQPLVGKYILPWFGGGSAVWTTCLLFFQVLLLAGYTYAHLLASRLPPHRQAQAHFAALVLAVIALAVLFPPAESWKSTDPTQPVARILLLLSVCVGLPYLLLSSTGPLLQRWFSYAYPQTSPYRLYALSNAGSLLALVSYPFVFEPALRLRAQTAWWAGAYVVFALLGAGCAGLLLRRRESQQAHDPSLEPAGPPPQVGRVLLWLGLSACGSMLLMATTNQITQDVAAVPFLWILPLSLYLLTFILCFDSPRWYFRPVFVPLLIVSVGGVCGMLHAGAQSSLLLQLSVYLAALFFCCMGCHGELVRLKPGPQWLTFFYLMVSLGGALGGAFVVVAAPRLFAHYWEFHLAVLVSMLLVLYVCGDDVLEAIGRRLAHRRGWLIGTLGGVGLSSCLVIGTVSWALGYHVMRNSEDTIWSGRNFYGALRIDVSHPGDPVWRQHQLIHGRIRHGHQYQAPEKRRWKTSYYGSHTGIGLTLERIPARAFRNLRIGVVGLGTGSLAVYAEPGDTLRFYEINPLVAEIADSEYFSFLRDARQRGVDVMIHLGDARIVMERQLAVQPQRFDVLAIDAFTSDAIPVHLLTRECFELYWKHLHPDGILAVHISNLYLDLAPVVRGLAKELGKEAYLVEDRPGPNAIGMFATSWMLVTSNPAFVERPDVQIHFAPAERRAGPDIVWTDDYSNLFQILR